MTESLEMLLNRENNLNKMSQMSSEIREDSKKVSLLINEQDKKQAKDLALMFWLRKYGTWIAIVLILLFLLFLKIYVF